MAAQQAARREHASLERSVDLDRLGGVAIIPHRGVDAALTEIDRVLQLPGIRAFLLRCYPNGTLDIEPEDDAVWARIAESGKPLTIHVSLANEMPRELKAKVDPPKPAAADPQATFVPLTQLKR